MVRKYFYEVEVHFIVMTFQVEALNLSMLVDQKDGLVAVGNEYASNIRNPI
jgi:hypothetical protein